MKRLIVATAMMLSSVFTGSAWAETVGSAPDGPNNFPQPNGLPGVRPGPGGRAAQPYQPAPRAERAPPLGYQGGYEGRRRDGYQPPSYRQSPPPQPYGRPQYGRRDDERNEYGYPAGRDDRYRRDDGYRSRGPYYDRRRYEDDDDDEF